MTKRIADLGLLFVSELVRGEGAFFFNHRSDENQTPLTLFVVVEPKGEYGSEGWLFERFVQLSAFFDRRTYQ